MKPFIDIAIPRGNVVFNVTGNRIVNLTAYALGYIRAARVLADRFFR